MSDYATAVLPDDPVALAALLVQVTDAVRTANLEALTEDELVTVAETVEQARRKADAADAVLITAVSDRQAFRRAGWIRLNQFLGFGLRLAPGEVKRRTLAASKVANLTNLQGQVLDPAYPATAAALADGAISTAHVVAIHDIVRRIPDRIPADVVADAESDLATAARTLAPTDLTHVGVRLLAHLDPDGQRTADRDRARTRSLTLARQDARLMSRLTAELTPRLRAKLDLVLEAWAAPGCNNPDDPDALRGAGDAPGVDPAVRDAAAARDQRSPAQRRHDALEALLDFVLTHPSGLTATGKLSSQLVITTDLADLAAGAGIAVTATGTRLPVSALVDLAADATPYLEVFAAWAPITAPPPPAPPAGTPRSWATMPARTPDVSAGSPPTAPSHPRSTRSTTSTSRCTTRHHPRGRRRRGSPPPNTGSWVCSPRIPPHRSAAPTSASSRPPRSPRGGRGSGMPRPGDPLPSRRHCAPP
ncbi:DUF222 domain-containing protein [Gordonia hydrophobica]|uniref:DUF222 domain-containing protein n=1 Tax=Gordonia hydrophobica TaxID=40516 RepID=A0ABZ2U197_9ACTN|nr:DUF222 domain-containing protein [Gordonia hydrophobica]MBM7368462.1 hypothetical protein [Gordonia hydrophobica]